MPESFFAIFNQTPAVSTFTVSHFSKASAVLKGLTGSSSFHNVAFDISTFLDQGEAVSRR